MADEKQMTTLKKVLHRIKPYTPGIVLSLCSAAVSVVMTLYIPVLIGRAIDCIVEAGRVDFARMGSLLTRVVLCALAAGLVQWGMREINNRITFQVTRDIRNEAFRHIQVLPLSYLDSHPQGELVSRVITDVDTFADGLLMGFTQFFTGIMTILGTLIIMLTIHPAIALVVILVTPLSLVVAGFIAKRTYSMFTLQSATRGELTGIMDEAVGEIKVVRAFGHEKASLS